MKTIFEARTIASGACAAFLALAAISCARDSGGPAGRAGDDGVNGGVTSAGAPSGAESAPSQVTGGATPPAVMPVGTAPAQSPTPSPGDTTPIMAAPPETPVALPSPAVLQAVTTARQKLEAVMAPLDGTKVRFVDCPETAACSARLEAPTLTGLRDLLQGVSAQQGGIGYVAREQLDAYTGHAYVADVTLGGAAEARPVPADENELLSN